MSDQVFLALMVDLPERYESLTARWTPEGIAIDETPEHIGITAALLSHAKPAGHPMGVTADGLVVFEGVNFKVTYRPIGYVPVSGVFICQLVERVEAS